MGPFDQEKLLYVFLIGILIWTSDCLIDNQTHVRQIHNKHGFEQEFFKVVHAPAPLLP